MFASVVDCAFSALSSHNLAFFEGGGCDSEPSSKQTS